jgi:RHS repeat-associated protein
LKSNETESVDPYNQSVSKRYNSVGNLLYQTNPMSVSDNLLPNSSFEYGGTWPDDWKQYVATGQTAQFAWASIGKYGNRSISISNPTSLAIVYCQQLIPYDTKEIYVVSGFIKTVSTIGKAYIIVEYLDASNNWLGQRTSYGITGTHDWARFQTIVTTVPVNTVSLRISVGLDPGQGTAYFDSIQLEKGNVVSAYNLIENSSFERYSSQTNPIPNNWTTSGNFITTDGRYQKTDITDPRVYVGSNSFQLIGEKGKNKYLTQRIILSGDSNTKLTLSGWSYQEGADHNGGYYLLQVAINYTEGPPDWRFANDFSKTMQGWQHVSVEVEPTNTFQSIDVYLYFYNQTGTAWFDGIRLEIGPSHTSYFYDTRNNYVIDIEDPLNNSVSYSYDYFGNKTQLIDGSGNKTTLAYNGANELTAVIDAKGFTTSYLYDGEGNVIEVTNARLFKKKFEYNEMNKISKFIDSLDRLTSFEYDKFGNQTKVYNVDSSTVSKSFDILNRLSSIYYNNVKQFDLEYDLNDNITEVTKTNGPITTFSYDLNNRLKSESEGVNTTSYIYDDNSNIKDYSIQGGSQTSYIYNKLNLIRSILKNNLTIANYIYNENGQVLSIYFTNGTYVSFEYNGANQLISLTNYNIHGIVMERFLYTYSTNGNIMSIQTTKGTINYQYDQLDQLTQETLFDGTTISYEYDSVGNRTKKIVLKGTTSTIITYTYNQADQLLSQNNQPFIYDLNGNLVDNGKNIFVYNPDNRLIEVRVKATGNTLASFTYDYKGRRKTMTTSSGTVTFYYDQRSNVIYETDQKGNVLVEYTWDNENRPVSMIKNSLTYYYHINGHGDVLALTDKDGNVVASYIYDAWGNILSQTGTMESLNPYRYAGYRFDEETGLYYLMARYYDANIGRFIIQDTFHRTDEDPLSINLHLYGNNNPVMNIDPDGTFSLKNPKTSYGARNELHLTKKEAEKLVKFFDSLIVTVGASGLGAYLGSLPKPWNIIAPSLLGATAWRLKKLKSEVKNKNNGNGVIIIYGGRYSSKMTEKQWKDLYNDGLGMGRVFTVRSK